MLNSLYQKAIAKRGSIKEEESNKDIESIISSYWENLFIDDSPEEFVIAAGDGSFNKKKFLTFNFCAVGAESIIYDDKLKVVDDSDIFEIEHISFLDELLSNYMSVYELKCALKSIQEYDVDYYMLDGSILGDLQNPVPRGAEQPANLKNNLDENLLNLFEMLLNKNSTGMVCHDVRKRYFPNIENKVEDYNLHLASIEKLIILKEILKNNKKMISISKTSADNEICKWNIPDIAFFDKFTKAQGISRIYYKEIPPNSYFPLSLGDFFKKFKFTIFYVRLEKNRNVLKVELPYAASKEEVLEIVERIKKLSVQGYPYLLNKAHNDVVISDRNIKELLKIAKIYETTNREVMSW